MGVWDFELFRNEESEKVWKAGQKHGTDNLMMSGCGTIYALFQTA